MENFVFMVMPFSDKTSESLYRNSTVPVIHDCGLDIIRADEIFSTNVIYEDIYNAIEKSVMVVADITGRNANCYYELGIAHTLKKSSTIMITRDSFEETPFDIAHFRILSYSDTIEGKSQYEKKLKNTIESLLIGLPDLYKSEFELVIRIINGMEQYHSLFGLLAFQLVNSPILENSNVYVEGNVPGYKDPINCATNARNFFQAFINQKYIAIIGENLVLTDIGSYFVKYLINKGYILHVFNDKIFTKDYTPLLNKYKEQKP